METFNFSVSRKDAGKRIDLCLKDELAQFSRNQIKYLLDTGRVLVNGRRVVIANWLLEENDEVEVRIPDSLPAVEVEAKQRSTVAASEASVAEALQGTSTTSEIGKSKLRQRRFRSSTTAVRKTRQPCRSHRRRYIKIIYEDADLLVVDKPAGVLSEVKKDSPRGDIVSMARDYLLRKYKRASGAYIGPVHRLDTEVSGVMVLAKSKTGRKVQEQFRTRSVRKEYIAIVEGRVERQMGRIRASLEKGRFRFGRKSRAAVSSAAKTAITEYKVKERYQDATLLHVSLITGRTHQIRAHMSHIGHPIVGDRVYGSHIPFTRIALHAVRLVIRHPVTGKRLSLSAAMPREIELLINRLRNL